MTTELKLAIELIDGGYAIDRNPTKTEIAARILLAEVRRLEAANKRLVEAIDLVVPVCNYLHHPKRLRHDLSDPCGCEKIVREAKKEAQ